MRQAKSGVVRRATSADWPASAFRPSTSPPCVGFAVLGGNYRPSENSFSSSLTATIFELKGCEAAAGISHAWGNQWRVALYFFYLNKTTGVVSNTVNVQNVLLKKCNCKAVV